jgi:hypothetical protein
MRAAAHQHHGENTHVHYEQRDQRHGPQRKPRARRHGPRVHQTGNGLTLALDFGLLQRIEYE